MAEGASTVMVTQTEAGTIHLKGDLNRDTVMKCWQQQQSEIQLCKANGESLKVDFTDINQVDTAGLAWLMHLVKACKASSVELELANLPDGLIKLAKLSNVDSLLSLQ